MKHHGNFESGSFGDLGTGIDMGRNLGHWDRLGIRWDRKRAETWDQHRGRNSLLISFQFPFFTALLDKCYTSILHDVINRVFGLYQYANK